MLKFVKFFTGKVFGDLSRDGFYTKVWALRREMTPEYRKFGMTKKTANPEITISTARDSWIFARKVFLLPNITA